MFLSFDGIDGCGKSTQMALFVEWLRERGFDVVTCRDPGGTGLGERIRELLLGDHSFPIGSCAEALLYMASRAQLVEEVILPNVESGRVVVSDRFLLANLAYQGYGGGLDLESLGQMGQFVTQGLLPRKVFLLDVPVEIAMARIGHALDRMERRDIDYRRRVRDGFLAQARLHPAQIAVIDTTRSIEVVQDEIRRIATPLLAERSAR
jgi:dTMP kinase